VRHPRNDQGRTETTDWRTVVTTLAEVEYDFPPLYCPLESAVNPHAAVVERRAEEWIAGSGMCSTERERAWVLASHSVDFYARFVPEADPDRLLATSLWVYWGFAFDDARCDEGPLSARPADFAQLAGTVQRALEAPTAADGGERFIPPLRDIASRFRALGTPAQVRRFAAAHRAWLWPGRSGTKPPDACRSSTSISPCDCSPAAGSRPSRCWRSRRARRFPAGNCTGRPCAR
jgi:hypothetical protein